MKLPLLLAAVLSLATSVSHAQMRITEWMYSGVNGEFIEFTNIGSVAIDLTGWSFDDNSGLAGTISLTSYGLVAPGESVLLLENADTDAFRTAWSLSGSVKIIGGNGANLGRADTINLYDASNTLIDTLAYGDEEFPGSIRTQNVSGITTPAVWGTNNVYGWFLSSVGDGYSSVSTGGDIGNPGILAVPEPGTIALLVVGAGACLYRWRRRSR